ncbi:hypothetical protein LOC59_13305 [Arthrobacter sp. zg-Y916]|uniref:Uncharacterized protein n=1 Tax=Arthrobacter caoxuetaonis TaxID=2886935 RepID=A0A9X1MHU3_9MICC|nr:MULTISPECIES: hypothetical protein [Arthrobacter]MCC3299510.1 hypothetical protein [Arthrobacter caoxuetaonis]MCC9194618.1 hypothetical protein [Arthrobacter sp. zg-Y916]USQ57760.1 hypothetical protein NF551_02570 [Arthrobacter caoxuetaonis]
MGNEQHGGQQHGPAELLSTVRAMEGQGIPQPKPYIMTVLSAAKAYAGCGETGEGRALCERAWDFAESVPALNHDREVAIHLYDAAWDHRRPRDPLYLTGAFFLAVEEHGPGSPWVPYLMRELYWHLQDRPGWDVFGSLREREEDEELAEALHQMAIAALAGFPAGTNHAERCRRSDVVGFAAQFLFLAGDDLCRRALEEWLSGPVSGYESGTALVSFLLRLPAYGPARAAAERTLQAVEADPDSTGAEKASVLLDVVFGIAMAPDPSGLARLPELEQRIGGLAHGPFSEGEAHVLQEKLYRYVIQRLDEGKEAQPAQREMFGRLLFDPFSAGSTWSSESQARR